MNGFVFQNWSHHNKQKKCIQNKNNHINHIIINIIKEFVSYKLVNKPICISKFLTTS